MSYRTDDKCIFFFFINPLSAVICIDVTYCDIWQYFWYQRKKNQNFMFSKYKNKYNMYAGITRVNKDT